MATLQLSKILNFGQSARFFRELTNFQFYVGSSWNGARAGSSWYESDVNNALHGVYDGQLTNPVLRRAGDGFRTPLEVFKDVSYDPAYVDLKRGTYDQRIRFLKDFEIMFLKTPETFDRGKKVKKYVDRSPFVTINELSNKNHQWLGLNYGADTWDKPYNNNMVTKARPGPQLVVINSNIISEDDAVNAYQVEPSSTAKLGTTQLRGIPRTRIAATSAENGTSQYTFKYVPTGDSSNINDNSPLRFNMDITTENSSDIAIQKGLSTASKISKKFDFSGGFNSGKDKKKDYPIASISKKLGFNFEANYEQNWSTVTKNEESFTDKKTFRTSSTLGYTYDFSAYRPNKDGLTIIDRDAYLGALESNDGVAPIMGREQWSLESGEEYTAKILISKATVDSSFSGNSKISIKENGPQPYIEPKTLFWNVNGDDELEDIQYEDKLRGLNSAKEWVKTYLDYGGLYLTFDPGENENPNELEVINIKGQEEKANLISINNDLSATIFNLATNASNISYNITYDIQKSHSSRDVQRARRSYRTSSRKPNEFRSTYDLDTYGQADMSEHLDGTSRNDHIDGSEEGDDYVETGKGSDLLTKFVNSSLDAGLGDDTLRLGRIYGTNDASLGFGQDKAIVNSSNNRINLDAGADLALVKNSSNTFDLGDDQNADVVKFYGVNSLQKSHLLNFDLLEDKVVLINNKSQKVSGDAMDRYDYQFKSWTTDGVVLRDSLTGNELSVWLKNSDWDFANRQTAAAAMLMSAGHSGFNSDFELQNLNSVDGALKYFLTNSVNDLPTYDSFGASLRDNDDRYAKKIYKGLRSADRLVNYDGISRIELKAIYQDSFDIVAAAEFNSNRDAADYFMVRILSGIDISDQ